MNGTGKTSFYQNAGIRKHLDAFSLINIPGRVYDPVIGYLTTPDPLIKIPGYSQDFNPYTYTHNNPLSFIDPSGYWDEACDIGGASDPGYNLITYTKELSTDDGTAYKINISTVLADTKAIGSHPLNLKSRGLKGGVPGRDISADLLPGGNMTSNSTGSSGSSGVDNSDFFHNLAIQNTFRGDYVSSVNFNNDLNKTGNSTSENLDKLNGLNANDAANMARGEKGDGGVDFSLPAMYLHFQFGGHQPMTIKMSSMDFSGTSQRELGLTGMTPGDIRKVNLFKAGPFFQPALAFGNARMRYLGNDRFTIVGDKNARFDFSPLVGGSSIARDAGNVFGAYINYNIWAIPISPLLVIPPLISGPYDVNFIGTTIIPK